MTEKALDVYERAIRMWGKTAQLGMVVEEAAELIVCIRHWVRGRASNSQLYSEIADMQIMLGQLTMILRYDGDETDLLIRAAMNEKLDRLDRTLAEQEARP